jgi:hypothetical protein
MGIIPKCHLRVESLAVFVIREGVASDAATSLYGECTQAGKKSLSANRFSAIDLLNRYMQAKGPCAERTI